jgi:hypothetical protein
MTDKSSVLVKQRSMTQVPVAANVVKDFLILCPTATRSSGVLETLYALYYLPPSYRVRVEGQSDLLLEEMYKLFRDDSVAERIDWSTDDTKKEKPNSAASPFSLADVVVYGNAQTVTPEAQVQSLVVFNLAARKDVTEEDHRFTLVSSDPEALASAILQVTR